VLLTSLLATDAPPRPSPVSCEIARFRSFLDLVVGFSDQDLTIALHVRGGRCVLSPCHRSAQFSPAILNEVVTFRQFATDGLI
jgi:hypothetical protein